MIRLENIQRIFTVGDEKVHALRDINLHIQAGEYVSIMGPSGSGKSTLLNLLGLLDRPNAGRYLFNERDVTTLSDDEQARVRREQIGFVFQFFHLVPRLTAADNIALPLLLAGRLIWPFRTVTGAVPLVLLPWLALNVVEGELYATGLFDMMICMLNVVALLVLLM